jgi:hypothetical protein
LVGEMVIKKDNNKSVTCLYLAKVSYYYTCSMNFTFFYRNLLQCQIHEKFVYSSELKEFSCNIDNLK